MDRYREMQAFCTVVDAGSFVAAADLLGCSKAAASRHVADLEARLGVRLLHRTTRRLSLTVDGKLFLERCRQLLRDIDSAEQEITSRGENASGRLRINAPVSYGIREIAPLWGQFRQRYPQVTLDITLIDRTVDLVAEGFDLAIRIGNLQSSSLTSRQLTTTRLLLCASPQYLAAHGMPQTLSELKDHSTISYSYLPRVNQWSLNGPDGDETVTINPNIVANNGETCCAAAVADQGIVFQPDFLVAEGLSRGHLVTLLPDYRGAELGVHAVFPSRRHIAPKTRAMINFLAEALGSGLPPSSGGS